jgi:aspartyl-tRNA(Asn)/glutamyl-tRNA(Gln) amidotransferase subunit C
LDIREYEAMAKLDLPENERAEISKRMKEMAESYNAVKAMDLAGVEPLVAVLDMQNVLREDIPTKIVTREELLSGAPEQYDGYFQAPRTLEV